jgi:hypothetical protein
VVCLLSSTNKHQLCFAVQIKHEAHMAVCGPKYAAAAAAAADDDDVVCGACCQYEVDAQLAYAVLRHQLTILRFARQGCCMEARVGLAALDAAHCMAGGECFTALCLLCLLGSSTSNAQT